VLTLSLFFTVANTIVVAEPACPPGPGGTSCITAGKRSVGDGAQKRDVDLATFFIDDRPATVAELKACIDEGSCAGAAATGKPDAPAQMTWAVAERYCAYAGKRLPSEAEWEVAQATKPSTSTLEWTRSWLIPKDAEAACKKPAAVLDAYTHPQGWAPAMCGSVDVLDACDGAFFCGALTQKIGKNATKPFARTGVGWGGTKTGTVRCASSTTYLTRFPSIFTTEKRPALGVPKEPSKEQKAMFLDVTEDTLDTPLCDKVGRSFVNCRDPRSYLKTNEPRQDVVLATIANLGGGYTGVGSDQNYTFVAWSRSRWAWIFDYDPNVVNWHHVMRALILASPSRHDFVAAFEAKNLERSVKILEDAYAERADKKVLVNLFRSSAPQLRSNYERQANNKAWSFTWLGDDERYAYVRAMFQQGRMQAFKGNMLDVRTMRGIAAAAKRLGVPIRVYYPSNAPEFWPFTDAYRENVKALPFDDRSVVVQTISSVKTGFGQTGYWHYNVQYGREHQALLALPGYVRERQLLGNRIKTDSTELTLSGMPSDASAVSAWSPEKEEQR
jgi:hypothetical protein